jgi:hypothetical protein
LEGSYVEEVLGNGAAMASRKVVYYQDFEASFDEVVGGDGADVAGSAGYQDFRHGTGRRRLKPTLQAEEVSEKFLTMT